MPKERDYLTSNMPWEIRNGLLYCILSSGGELSPPDHDLIFYLELLDLQQLTVEDCCSLTTFYTSECRLSGTCYIHLSPVLERCRRDGLDVPVAKLEEGTERDLYKAVSLCSLNRSAAMSALDSSCSGMLFISDEKGLSGFSRLINQLVLPGREGNSQES